MLWDDLKYMRLFVKGDNLPEPNVSEAFNVLIKELKA
jgi:DNA-directed RNA polymerase beta subunit